MENAITKKTTIQEELMGKGFIINKVHAAGQYMFFVDEHNQRFAIAQHEYYEIYSFRHLLNFEYCENGRSIVQGRGLATVAGGLAFGVIGAVAGASGSRHVEGTCTSMLMRIYLDDLHTPQIVLSLFPGQYEIKTNSAAYSYAHAAAKELVAILSYVENRAQLLCAQDGIVVLPPIERYQYKSMYKPKKKRWYSGVIAFFCIMLAVFFVGFIYRKCIFSRRFQRIYSGAAKAGANV